MPNVTIEVRKRYTKEQEEGIINAVHAALMEGIKTPDWAGGVNKCRARTACAGRDRRSS
jgi:phenylpyruvate tautomerase PptA (4-oxalocrotonate tautomerase family)